MTMDMHPNLEIFITEDGSPTLSYRREDGYVEKMHHSGGAFSESVYIYQNGLATGLDAGVPANVISVGLGLAYNELICLAEFARRGIEGTVWSFETLDVLKDQFVKWMNGEAGPDYTRILDEICARTEKHFEINGLKVRAKRALDEGRLQLRGSFPQDVAGVKNAGVIFYDAFSNKMHPELWQESQLRSDLEPLLAEHAVLCTYSQTGAMKRTLKNMGFELQDRAGFLGKRGSTLAVR